MKNILITTIAAVVLVGCGPSVDIHEAATDGNIEAVKQHLAADTDVKDKHKKTSLYFAASGRGNHTKTVEIFGVEGTDVNAKDFEGKTHFKRAAVVPF